MFISSIHFRRIQPAILQREPSGGGFFGSRIDSGHVQDGALAGNIKCNCSHAVLQQLNLEGEINQSQDAAGIGEGTVREFHLQRFVSEDFAETGSASEGDAAVLDGDVSGDFTGFIGGNFAVRSDVLDAPLTSLLSRAVPSTLL